MTEGPAYVIGHLTVKDPEKWAEYRRDVPATLAEWGGELVFRGENFFFQRDQTQTGIPN